MMRLKKTLFVALGVCIWLPSQPASAIRVASRRDSDGVFIATVSRFQEGDEALTNRSLPPAKPVIPINARVKVVKVGNELVISYRNGEVEETVSANDLRELNQNNLSLQVYNAKPSAVSTCAYRDLRSQLGRPRDQGKRGWCYAYATADYLTWLTGQKVSAADLGLRESLRQSLWQVEKAELSPADGGMNTAALRDVLEKGYCLERDFPSEGGEKKYGQTLAHMADLEGPKRISCETPQKLALTLSQSVAVDKDALRAVDEMLDQYQPSVLGILARYLLSDRPSRGDRFAYDRGETAAKDGHAILVVARREQNGKCEYFLRNSWGEKCSPYSKKLRKSCVAKDGGVWVDRDRLELMTVQTVFLQ